MNAAKYTLDKGIYLLRQEGPDAILSFFRGNEAKSLLVYSLTIQPDGSSIVNAAHPLTLPLPVLLGITQARYHDIVVMSAFTNPFDALKQHFDKRAANQRSK